METFNGIMVILRFPLITLPYYPYIKGIIVYRSNRDARGILGIHCDGDYGCGTCSLHD